MVRKHIRRFVLIIRILRKKSCTFEDIAAFLKEESTIDGENHEVSVRTFQRDLKEIQSIFGIEIRYNRKSFMYEIVEVDNSPDIMNLVSILDIFTDVELSQTITECVIPESRKPSGMEHFRQVLEAIRKSQFLEFNYTKFWDAPSVSLRIVCPIKLKQSQNRWYLLAKEHDSIKVFGLDRITNLTILKQKFEKEDLNVEDLFHNSFGVIHSSEKPDKIILKYSKEQGQYIKSFPLHRSQKLILETDLAVIVQLNLIPTYDFLMEIVSTGNHLEVISPQSLRNQIREMLLTTLKNYQ